MKRKPDDARLPDRMAPGVLALDGFLGTDPRPLKDIVAEDAAAVRGLGATHTAMAASLQAVADAATAALGKPVPLPGDLAAVARDAMGRIPCPWDCGETFPKGEIEVTDRRTGRKVCFSPLSIHLVAEHGFYQGRGSRYRLEPADLVRLLGGGEEAPRADT